MTKEESHPFYNFCDKLDDKVRHYLIPPLLFRGQSDEDWNITSGLYRKLSSEGVNATPKIIRDEVASLIDACKARENSYPAIKNYSELELLAEVQHMGGKTPLIDFSFSPIIALYFACAHHHDKDGSVLAIYPFVHDNIQRLPASITFDWQKVAYESIANLFYWQPPQVNYRIMKQDSVFVFNSSGKINANDLAFSITIKKEDKPLIMQKLKQVANIDFDAIYPDFLGYLKDGGESG